MKASALRTAAYFTAIAVGVFHSGGLLAAEKQRTIQSSTQAATPSPEGLGNSISVSNLSLTPGTPIFMIMGANETNHNAGAAYIFKATGLASWTQEKILAPVTQQYAAFGNSVSISLDGKLALVGAPNDGASVEDPYSGPGSVYVFKYANNTWQKVTVLRVSKYTSYPNLGESVFISPDGSTAFLGAPGDNGGKGAVWVYDLTDGTPKYKTKLVPSDNSGAAKFGSSISSSKNGAVVVIGGPDDGTDGIYGGIGASWVFELKNGKWKQSGAKIVATGGAGTAQWQGKSVSMKWTGDSFAVGAPNDGYGKGAAYVFNRNASGAWVQKAQLKDSADTPSGYFGMSVMMSPKNGSTIAVGQPNASVQGGGMGRVLTYVKNQSGWSFTASPAILPNPCNRVGASLALSASAEFLAVGAPFTTVNDQQTGAACLYTQQNSGTPPSWNIVGGPISAQ